MRALVTTALTVACAAPELPVEVADDSGAGSGVYEPADGGALPCDSRPSASLALARLTTPPGADRAHEPLLPQADLVVWEGVAGGLQVRLDAEVAHVPRFVFFRTSLHTADGVDLGSAPPLDDATSGHRVQEATPDPTPEQGCVTEGRLEVDAYLNAWPLAPAASGYEALFAALCGLPATLGVEVAWSRCWDGEACGDVTRPRAARVELPVVLQPDPRVMAACAPR